ncbi:GDSL esterase/lipase [Quillaja saponaria]|uniref:GDSL esterase/lipase n=1 Tax=Quillaja saponaria TaxID=32244 RepID=A0AAD7L7U2_QUISA|nr:GDSL esterase/lipase [Quillaja saponaria]
MAMVSMHAAAHTNHVVPDAIFVFGDSTVDVGTNNFLKGTGARANFRYNGIDFPHSTPTGRFSNGFNVADQIEEFLRFEVLEILEFVVCGCDGVSK